MATAAQVISADIVPVHDFVLGRMRLKVPGLYRNPVLRRRLASSLSQLQGIETVRASVLTGNVLVEYHGELKPRGLVDRVARCVEALDSDAMVAPSVAEMVPDDAGRPSNGLAAGPKLVARQSPPQDPREAGQLGAAWHSLSREQALLRSGGSRRHGLTERAAQERLARLGPNELPQPAGRSVLEMLLPQLTNLPVALLGASAALSVVTGGLADALVILGVIGINAAIGYATERRVERAIASMGRSEPGTASVLRDGVKRSLAAREDVAGDILALQPGTRVAADARLLSVRRLSVDESSLTGESLAVTKDAGCVFEVGTALGDRRNLVHMGTMVTGGSGRTVVVATGRDTEIGRLHEMVGDTRAPDTPLQRQLGRLGTQLGMLSGGVCAGVFLIGLLRGYGALGMFKNAISLAVAAVPEGLPVVATTTLALGVRVMHQRRVAIRQLDAVETLGAVRTFCLDKTGTLTINRMAIAAIRSPDVEVACRNGGFLKDGLPYAPRDSETLRRLLEVVTLCSETGIGGDGADPVVTGSATESALIQGAIGAGLDVRMLRRRHPRKRLEFRSERQPYMRSIHDSPGGGELAAIKGSPADVLALCDCYRDEAGLHSLDDARRRAILRDNEVMAGDSLRVLGVAEALAPAGVDATGACPVWLGMVGLADPVRPGMADLMRTFHKAGIETVMITGDQAGTALAVGRELNLANDGELRILESERLDEAAPELLAGLVDNVHVFARASPADKLKIVQALQATGRIVAMTGDGINDAPALKAADIGVAMGRDGTSVARSVADVVLEDDNIHTMVAAIHQGRGIYDNIRKTVRFLLSTNFSEIEVMLVGTAVGLNQPLNPMQLLWINLVTDIFPGLALSLEPTEEVLMRQPPRDPDMPIITREALARTGLESLVIAGGALGAFAYGLSRYGPGPRTGTLAFTTLTAGQLLHAYSCRSDKQSLFRRHGVPRNRHLDLAIGASLALQGLTLVVPGLRTLLGTTALGLLDLGVVAAGAGLPLAINELVKGTRNRAGG